MNHVYKPSGKISFLFFPVFVIMLFIMAICAFVCIFCIHFSPYFLFDAFIFIFATIKIVTYSAIFCVRAGKVRNTVFSAISGIILGAFYWYFLIIFYMPVKNIFAIKNIVIYVISFMLSMVTLGGEFSIFSISILGACLASSVPILGVILVSLIGNTIHAGVGGAVRILLNNTSISSNTIHNKASI